MAGAFNNFDVVVRGILKNPSLAAQILERELSQADLDRIEALFTPDAKDEDEHRILVEARGSWKRDGITDARLHAALDTRIGEVTPS